MFYSIDPLQSGWGNVGLYNLKTAGFQSILRFSEDYSYNVLPGLLKQGVRLDFAYLDSTKIYDVLMVDAFFLSLLLRDGGILVLDDCLFPGVSRVARYLTKIPNLKVHSAIGKVGCSLTRRIAHSLSKMFPKRVAVRIFNDETINLSRDLGIHAHCVAFQRVGPDLRGWDWYESF